MKFLHKHKNIRSNIHKSIVVTVLYGCYMAFLYAFLCGPILYENITDSGPQGLYIRTFDQKINRNDWVVICPHNSLLKEDLLKQAVGFPGEIYVVNNMGLVIHNKTFPIAQKKELCPPKMGKYLIQDGSILFMNHLPDSYDGRYFGPVFQRDIRVKVKLFLPYEPFYDFMKGVYL